MGVEIPVVMSVIGIRLGAIAEAVWRLTNRDGGSVIAVVCPSEMPEELVNNDVVSESQHCSTIRWCGCAVAEELTVRRGC